MVEYVKKGLLASGINFAQIPKKEILNSCKMYDGNISKQNYDAVIEAINSLYERIKVDM